MNTNITGGRVQVEDGLKKNEEYAPPRKALVEIRFEVPEGQDAQSFIDNAVAAADATLRKLLKQSASPTAVTAAAPAAAAVVEPKAPAKKAATKKEPTDKDKLAAAAGLPVDGLDETLASEAAKPEDDGLDDLLGDTAPAPVTDAELGKKAQEANARLKSEKGDKHDPTVIRKLIAEYAGEGKRINDIPAAKRHDFLTKLAALK